MTSLERVSEFGLLAELARAGALTPTALTLDPGTRYEQWEALGAMLGQLSQSSCWLIGDWIDFGERAYGEKYAQAVEETGLAESTLMNYASVARRVPPARRRATLPFSHHALVQGLQPEEQELWLERAEAEGWTRAEMASALKGDSPSGGRSLRELAEAVWISSVVQPRGGYLVPDGPMQDLADAL